MGRIPKDMKEKIQNNLEEIRKISEKYKINEKILIDLVKDFGSIDAFKEEYINLALNKSIRNYNLVKRYAKKLNGKLVDMFDLSTTDLICRETNYTELNRVPKFTVFINANDLVEKTSNRVNSMRPERAIVMNMFYGINGYEKSKMPQIVEKLGFSKQNIYEKLRNAKKLYEKDGSLIKEIETVIDQQKIKSFIQTYFEVNDIFCNLEEKQNEKQEDDEIQLLIKDLIIEISDCHPYTSFRPLSIKPGEGMEQIFNKINILKSNIHNIIENLDDKDNKKELEINFTLLNRVIELEKKFFTMQLKEEYLSNDYENFIELYTEFKDLEKKATTIEKMNFSIRTYNSLKRAGINTLENLLQKTSNDLKQIKQLGDVSYKEIIEKVNEMGFELKDEKNSINTELQNSIDKLKIRYDVLNIKIIESQRLRQKMMLQIKNLQVNKINIENVIERINELKFLNKKSVDEAQLENILDMKEKAIVQYKNKNFNRIKLDADKKYTEKRIEEFSKEQNKIKQELDEMGIEI